LKVGVTKHTTNYKNIAAATAKLNTYNTKGIEASTKNPIAMFTQWAKQSRDFHATRTHKNNLATHDTQMDIQPMEQETKILKEKDIQACQKCNPIYIKGNESHTEQDQNLQKENEQLKFKIKRLKLLLCAKEAFHKVIRILLEQVQNTSSKEVPEDKIFITPKTTDEASSQINKDPLKLHSHNKEKENKIFHDILQNIRYFSFPPISLKQHYEITSRLFLGIHGLPHLTYKHIINNQDFKTILGKCHI